MSLQDALIAGRQAGMRGTAAGANPYDIHTQPQEYSVWERGRSAVEAQKRTEDLKRRPRTSCWPCTCGGRGLCRDAA